MPAQVDSGVRVEFEYDPGDRSVGIADGWNLSVSVDGGSTWHFVTPDFGLPVGAWRLEDDVAMGLIRTLHDWPEVRWAVAEEYARLVECERVEALAENRLYDQMEAAQVAAEQREWIKSMARDDDNIEWWRNGA